MMMSLAEVADNRGCRKPCPMFPASLSAAALFAVALYLEAVLAAGAGS